MIKELNFILVHVNDISKVLPFYTEKLGFEIEDQQPGFVQFKQPLGTGAVLALSQEGENTPSQQVELWWLVDDADATHAELAAKDVSIVEPLQDQPFGRTFAIQDPLGNRLYMMKLAYQQ